MIRFDRDGKQVVCKIALDVPRYEERTLLFFWNCNSEIYAGLLTAELQKQLERRIQAIRREAYSQGWKDAKAKRRKQEIFSPRIG